jgi:hypothetical protein
MARARVARSLDSRLLARLGLAEFSSPVRHRGDPFVRGNCLRKPLAYFVTGACNAGAWNCLESGCGLAPILPT